MILQLNPSIPMHVLNKGDGYAFAIIDYSQEHDLLFVVAMNDTGEIWTVSNKNIRMQKNISMERKIKSILKNCTCTCHLEFEYCGQCCAPLYDEKLLNKENK